MFFNKPIHEITFEDVVAFCKRQIPEGKQLDYKYLLPKNKEKFAKVIASFANAMGGTIIIGVNDDKNDKPCPPFTGIAYHEKIRNTIEDIIQVYIDPVVFVDVNICVSKDGQRMFVVVDIPQSNLTPHLVGKLKRAYIRTGQSSRPEMIVHPSRLPWLLDHRKKSERLRHILYDKAESHFDNYLKNHNLNPATMSVASLSLLPLYPQEPLLNYRQLPTLITHCLQTPPEKMSLKVLPVQDGAVVAAGGISRKTIEFNAYGLLMSKWNFAQETLQDGKSIQTVPFTELARNIVLFFDYALRFFDKISFGGPLTFRLKLSHTRSLQVRLNTHKATVLEDYVRLDEDYNLPQLSSKLHEILYHILQTCAWSLGLQIPEKEIKALIEACIQEQRHV